MRLALLLFVSLFVGNIASINFLRSVICAKGELLSMFGIDIFRCNNNGRVEKCPRRSSKEYSNEKESTKEESHDDEGFSERCEGKKKHKDCEVAFTNMVKVKKGIEDCVIHLPIARSNFRSKEEGNFTVSPDSVEDCEVELVGIKKEYPNGKGKGQTEKKIEKPEACHDNCYVTSRYKVTKFVTRFRFLLGFSTSDIDDLDGCFGLSLDDMFVDVKYHERIENGESIIDTHQLDFNINPNNYKVGFDIHAGTLPQEFIKMGQKVLNTFCRKELFADMGLALQTELKETFLECDKCKNNKMDKKNEKKASDRDEYYWTWKLQDTT